MRLLIILIALFALLFIIVRPLLMTSNARRNKKRDEHIEEMVECACCSIYTARNEALISQGKYFCSKECLQKAHHS